MKKLLLGSASLCLFSISIMIFQMSCKKDATAQASNSNYVLPPATTSSLGGVIVGNGLSVTGNGTLSVTASGTQLNKIIYTKTNGLASDGIYTANYDGTNQTKINISLPANVTLEADAHLSPDGQTVFFQVSSSPNFDKFIYACNIDGSNVHPVIANAGEPTYIHGAY